jgi:NADH:ubiquinone oxidoreductase subunit C
LYKKTYTNSKIYFKYILNICTFSFIENRVKPKVTNIILSNNSFYYLCVHVKLSTIFRSSYLTDIFTYDIPNNHYNSKTTNWFNWRKKLKNLEQKTNNTLNLSQAKVVIYNFHSLYTQDRFFIFVDGNLCSDKTTIAQANYYIDSITALFPSGNWLEREVAEFHGILFSGKKDLRNLMLQYGDTSTPFQKLFPTIGIKEMFYDPIKDTLIQKPLSIQG